MLCEDTTLMAFVWKTEKANDPSSLRSFVGLFDLNQWYHAQMPQKLHMKRKGPVTRSQIFGYEYFAFFSLVDKGGVLYDNPGDLLLVSSYCDRSSPQYEFGHSPNWPDCQCPKNSSVRMSTLALYRMGLAVIINVRIMYSKPTGT